MCENEKVRITIFQAPYASLMEHGLYPPTHDSDHPFCETVPAEYYLPVFKGDIAFSQPIPEDGEQRSDAILERVYDVFNTVHPAGYCGRSLSEGDVVKLEGRYFLCVDFGFQQVTFQASKERPTENPTVCPVIFPDGAMLRVAIHRDAPYPSININLLAPDGSNTCLCFVEHNPEKPLGHELCIGVYCDSEDEPAYYDSYCRSRESTES